MVGELDFLMPTKLVFGEGRLKEVGEKVKGYGKKALLVTGRKAMKKLGLTHQVIEYLKAEGVEAVLYDKVEPNPSKQTVNTGGKLAKGKGCDVIVVLGGGSALDAAKGIAVVAKYGADVWDYMGEGNVPGPVLPLVGIPSTAGTGSETTPYAVISFKEKKMKYFMASPYIFFKVAIVDPLVMMSVPRYITAYTGMDAFTHAVEAYTSRMAQPISDRLALQAIELAAGSLPQVVMNGDNLEARTNMALASSLAGMAIAQAGCGNAHGLGEPLGGFFETDHGAVVGLLLPHVMEYNILTNPDKFINIAKVMGEKVDDLSLRSAAMKAVEAVRNLLVDIGLPQRLRDLGVKKEVIPEMAEEVMRRNPNGESARTVGLKDVKYLFQRAF